VEQGSWQDPRTTDDDTPRRPSRSSPLIALLFAAGLLIWVWTGDWRWAVSGFAAALVVGSLLSALEARAGSPRRARRDDWPR
jgi:hypothetical protein